MSDDAFDRYKGFDPNDQSMQVQPGYPLYGVRQYWLSRGIDCRQELFSSTSLSPFAKVLGAVFFTKTFEFGTLIAWISYDEIIERSGAKSDKAILGAVKELVAGHWIWARSERAGFAFFFLETFVDDGPRSQAEPSELRKNPTEIRPPVDPPRAMRKEVFERDDYSCVICKSRFEISVDHIHPKSRGGRATLDNLQTLCRPCNSRKGNRAPSTTAITDDQTLL